MKILWFTNTPCGAADSLGVSTVRGGWLQSLESQIKDLPDVELSVAFFINKKKESFEVKNVNYFPIYSKQLGKTKKYFNRLVNYIETTEYIEEYIKIVEIVKPDVIHIHGTELTYGLLNERIKDIPIVISIQGNFTVYSKFYFRGISKNHTLKFTRLKDIIKITDSLYEYRKLKKRVKLEKRILSNTKFIFGRTFWDNSITRVLAKNSTYYHSNEILRDSFYENFWESKNFNNKSIVTICSANLYKGIEMAFESCVHLHNIGVKDIKWRMIGPKLSDKSVYICKKKYKVNPEDIGLQFLGNLEEDDVVKEMLSSSVFIQVSHIENSPNSLCEAMILGLPVIASCAGGTVSLLDHEKEGIIVQDGDSLALAGAILNIFSTPLNEIEEMSNYSRLRAQKRHDRIEVSTKLIEDYKKIIQHKK